MGLAGAVVLATADQARREPPAGAVGQRPAADEDLHRGRGKHARPDRPGWGPGQRRPSRPGGMGGAALTAGGVPVNARSREPLLSSPPWVALG